MSSTDRWTWLIIVLTPRSGILVDCRLLMVCFRWANPAKVSRQKLFWRRQASWISRHSRRDDTCCYISIIVVVVVVIFPPPSSQCLVSSSQSSSSLHISTTPQKWSKHRHYGSSCNIKVYQVEFGNSGFLLAGTHTVTLLLPSLTSQHGTGGDPNPKYSKSSQRWQIKDNFTPNLQPVLISCLFVRQQSRCSDQTYPV